MMFHRPKTNWKLIVKRYRDKHDEKIGVGPEERPKRPLRVEVIDDYDSEENISVAVVRLSGQGTRSGEVGHVDKELLLLSSRERTILIWK